MSEIKIQKDYEVIKTRLGTVIATGFSISSKYTHVHQLIFILLAELLARDDEEWSPSLGVAI